MASSASAPAVSIASLSNASCVPKGSMGHHVRMDTVTSEVSIGKLRSSLPDMIGRVEYAGERVGVTRQGKLAAVIVGVDDLEALEQFEMAQDVAAHREAVAADDGERVSLAQLRSELAS